MDVEETPEPRWSGSQFSRLGRPRTDTNESFERDSPVPLAKCTGCNRTIRTNLIYDEVAQSDWHAECYQLRRLFEDDPDFSEDASPLEDIERIVKFWRSAYFDRNEEYHDLKEDMAKLERRYNTSSTTSIRLSEPEASPRVSSSISVDALATAAVTDDARELTKLLKAHERLNEELSQEVEELEAQLYEVGNRYQEEKQRYNELAESSTLLKEQLEKSKQEEERLWGLLDAADTETTALTDKLQETEAELAALIQGEPKISGSSQDVEAALNMQKLHNETEVAAAVQQQKQLDEAIIEVLRGRLVAMQKQLDLEKQLKDKLVEDLTKRQSDELKPKTNSAAMDMNDYRLLTARLTDSQKRNSGSRSSSPSLPAAWIGADDTSKQDTVVEDIQRRTTMSKQRRMSIVAQVTGQIITPTSGSMHKEVATQSSVPANDKRSSSGSTESPRKFASPTKNVKLASLKYQGQVQKRLVALPDGKRAKSSTWSSSWAVLKGTTLYFYPSEKTSTERDSLLDSLRVGGGSVERVTDSKRGVGPSGTCDNLLSLKTPNEGEFWLEMAAAELNSWLNILTEACNLDLSAVALARRSHCIPHRFRDESFLLHPTKCKLCGHMISMRGYRCTYCDYCCHEKCSTKVPPNCGLADLTTILSLSEKSKGDKDRRSQSVSKSFSKLTLGRKRTSSVFRDGDTLSAPLSPGVSKSVSMEFTKTVASIGSDIFGVAIKDLPGAEDEVPFIVTLCVNSVERRGLDIEGLYRLSGIKGEIEKLKQHFSFGRVNLDNGEWSDVHVITGVVKLWFRELPDPLLVHELFTQFISIGTKMESEEIKITDLIQLLPKLPRRHYVVLRYFIAHLARVAACSSQNKMFAQNLGAVFGPTLLRSPNDNIGSLAAQCTVVELMIKHNSRIFQ